MTTTGETGVSIKYAGAEWVKSGNKTELSPLGEDVANLLGEWAFGIYHLEDMLHKVDWANKLFIEINYYNELATFDFDRLTALVFLAHWYCIRVSIRPCNFRYIKILFHRRSRKGAYSQMHPTLDEVVKEFKEIMVSHGISEVIE